MSDSPSLLDNFEPPEFLIAQVNSAIRDMMNTSLRKHGLKLVEWRVLQCLCDNPHPLTVAELAELAVIDRTVASRLIDKLVTRGLVAKEAMAQDKRFMSISLTDDGREAYIVSLSSTRAARARLFHGLAEEDLKELNRLLEMMQRNATQPGRALR